VIVAIKHQPLTIDNDGQVAGHDAGDTLVRRLLRLFPGAQLIGDQPRHYPGVDVVTVEMVDAANTVVINMDVIDSVAVWSRLRTSTVEPKVMNFLWCDATRYDNPIEVAEVALSCALFPTFANSDRTMEAVSAFVHRWTIKPLAERARISGVNLGVRLEHVQPRQEPTTPVVLYPAIYVSARKQPDVFIDIVTKVARRTPIIVEARLSESHLVTESAMRLSRERWAHMGPLLSSRADYWKALAHTTAFLATATEESYGLEYIEALIAGAVGVFPDREWARSILPANYPFFYQTSTEAENLLYRTVTDTAACRQELDDAVGGNFIAWLQDHHNDDNFEASIEEHIKRWFGPIATA
jgi:hypothetical protein